MKRIPLSIYLFALVDDEDFWTLAEFHWYCMKNGTNGYYAIRRENTETIYMHRLIMGAASDQEVDHKDGDGLNNRRSNLRLCSHGENMMNRALYGNNKSGATGVWWVPHAQKWRARVILNRKSHYLGYFDSFEAAVAARDKEAARLFGDFNRAT